MSARSLVFSLVACNMSEASVHQKSCFYCSKTMIFDKASFADKGAKLHRHASQYLFKNNQKYIKKAFKSNPKQGMPNVYQKNTKNASKKGARRGPQTPRTTPWPLQTTFFRPREPPGELREVSRRLSGLTRAAPGLAPGPPGPPETAPGPFWQRFRVHF